MSNPEVRAKYGILEGWVSIVINTVLFVVKLLVGLKIRSTSLIADSIHTLADSLTSVVVIIGFLLARKPSDKEHPFGHGNIEPIITLIIAVLLFVAGAELLKSSFNAVLHPVSTHASTPVILFVSVTILIKEIMARFSFILGDHIDSDTLKADALHHRSDAIATLLVVVALVASRYGYDRVDGIMGILVSVAIFISAYYIMKEAVNPLIGQAPSDEFIRNVEVLCMSTPGVLGVHDIIAHRYGQTSITSLHIEVDCRESALKLHRLAEKIEEAVGTYTGGMVVVHIDPVNRDHPAYDSIQSAVSLIVEEHEKAVSFHDLRVVGDTIDGCTVLFDIVTHEENDRIIPEIQSALSVVFPTIKSIIRTTPRFSFKPEKENGHEQ